MTILFCKAILLLMTGLSGMPLKMTTGFSMLWNLTFRINPGPTGNIIISAHIWHPLSFRNGPGTPLGIRNPQWLESVKGYTLGCGGLHLSTEELSRFGQLCLNKGQWEGKQLVSASWIEEATACQISNKIEGKVQHPDECAGYGYFFWRCSRDNAYCGNGYAGQRIFVLPEQDACIAVTAHEFNSGSVSDCVWNHIVPQLK